MYEDECQRISEALETAQNKMLLKWTWIQNFPWLHLSIFFHALVNELATFSHYFCKANSYGSNHLYLSILSKEKRHSTFQCATEIPSVNKHLLSFYVLSSDLGIAQGKRQPLPFGSSLASAREPRKTHNCNAVIKTKMVKTKSNGKT